MQPLPRIAWDTGWTAEKTSGHCGSGWSFPERIVKQHSLHDSHFLSKPLPEATCRRPFETLNEETKFLTHMLTMLGHVSHPSISVTVTLFWNMRHVCMHTHTLGRYYRILNYFTVLNLWFYMTCLVYNHNWPRGSSLFGSKDPGVLVWVLLVLFPVCLFCSSVWSTPSRTFLTSISCGLFVH